MRSFSTNPFNSLGNDAEFSQKQVPGLKSLLDDYISPDVAVDSVDWRRRMLKVFKDSETDNTYQDFLAKHTPQEQELVERFVAGEDPEKISDGFVMGPSMGCREELEKLRQAEHIVHVSAAEINTVRGADLVATDDDWFHTTVRKISNFFGGHHSEHGHLDGILVRESNHS